ncbi:hypothetical protein JCM1841_006483 [Sporobolomyces salmonicolor]
MEQDPPAGPRPPTSVISHRVPASPTAQEHAPPSHSLLRPLTRRDSIPRPAAFGSTDPISCATEACDLNEAEKGELRAGLFSSKG